VTKLDYFLEKLMIVLREPHFHFRIHPESITVYNQF